MIEDALAGLFALAGSNPYLTLLAIFAGTFVLEDAATVSAALLAAGGAVAWSAALGALFAGIFLGDLGLYGLGRLAQRHRRLRRFIGERRIALGHEWLTRRLWLALVGARFVPGMRLPTYTASGFFRVPFARFALITAVASALWTTILFTLIASFGALVVDALGPWRWAAAAAAIVLVIALPRLLERRTAAHVLARPHAAPHTAPGLPPLEPRERTISYFEFWKPRYFYVPIFFYWLWLGLRHRGLTLPTAANPCFPLGGFIGESKFDVLSALPPSVRRHVAPFAAAVRHGERTPEEDAGAAIAAAREAGFGFPMVAKPDIGCRGAGVKIIADADALAAYFARFPAGARAVVQELVTHEPEAGILWARAPGEPRGRIFSLTLKYAPYVTGDGEATLRELIERDWRAGLVPQLYLARHRDRLGRVVPKGEHVRLAFAGNHAKGSIFRDGRAHVTAKMEETFDALARAIPDFHFGRFDVRFASLDALKEGRDFTIVEVNGSGGEATHIWDPKTTLTEAYATLMEQYRLVWRIGAANRAAGARPAPLLRLARAYLNEQRLTPLYPPAD